MFPTENELLRLVELRVRQRVLEWLEAENEDFLTRGRYANSRVDEWNELMANMDWLLLGIGQLEKIDLSWREYLAEVLDWLYAETLWELLHLEEQIRVLAEFFPLWDMGGVVIPEIVEPWHGIAGEWLEGNFTK